MVDHPTDPSLLVLEHAPYPVELLDHQCRVLYHNPVYAQVFGNLGESILGQTSRAFPEILPDGRSRQSILHQAEREKFWKGQLRLSCPGDSPLPVRMTVFPVPGREEGETDYAVLYEDIRQEVTTREALVHQQNVVAIRSRQTQMGELLSMIAHQWRQPLTVVMSLIGNIQLKARLGGVDLTYLGSKLERMTQTVQMLSETIDAFRHFYAPTKFQTEEDLSVLTRRALDMVIPSLQKMGATVELSFPEVPLKASVFSGEFLQVALELITNARDALSVGGAVPSSPHLRISVLREGTEAVVRIENNGKVISPEVLPHIYEPYYTTKEGAAGTGLGLYMCKLLIENHHGGTLTASSSDGWTAFACRLPLEIQP